MPCTVKFNYPQLMGWWVSNGGSIAAAPIAAAVAMAESGGCVDAVSPRNSNGTTDAGLWQINSIHATNAQMVDPVANVKMAISLSGNGTSWTPWSTYNSGAYQRYLAGGQPSYTFPAGLKAGATLTGFSPWNNLLGPFGGIGPFSGLNPVSGLSDTARSIAGLVQAILKPIEYADAAALWLSNPRNWGRVVMVGAGVLIIGEGLHMLTGVTPSPVRIVTSSAGQVTPTVKAVRTVRVAQAVGAERRATTVTQHEQRRRTTQHAHEQRRRTAEHATEQKITAAEGTAAARRYGGAPSRRYNPDDEEPF